MSDSDFEVTSSWRPKSIEDISGTADTPLAESQRAMRLASIPLVVLVAVNSLVFATVYVPELLLWKETAKIVAQIQALAFTLPGKPGVADSASFRLAPMLALLGALLLTMLAQTKLRWAPIPVWAVAGSTVVFTVFSVWHAHSNILGNITAICLALGIAVACLVAAAKLVSSGEVEGTLSFAFGWVVLFAFSFAPPLAIGRWLFGQNIQVWAWKVHDAEKSLGNVATVWNLIVGISVAIGVWALFQLLPPWKGKNIVGIFFVLVLAVGPGVALAGQYAIDANLSLMSSASSIKPPAR